MVCFEKKNSILIIGRSGILVTGLFMLGGDFNPAPKESIHLSVTTSCLIDRWLAIYKCFISFDSLSHRRYIHRWRSIYQVIVDGEPVTGIYAVPGLNIYVCVC